VLLCAGVLLIAGNLTWFTVELATSVLEVDGQSAAPPLSGLALASVALAGALALAPFVLRIILGLVQTGLGALAVVTVLPALTDPEGRVAPTVTAATGIDGDQSVRESVLALTAGPWPLVALVAAVLSALVGVAITATARRWPVPGRRYAASAPQAAPLQGRARAEDEWDALSRGDDPTS